MKQKYIRQIVADMIVYENEKRKKPKKMSKEEFIRKITEEAAKRDAEKEGEDGGASGV